MKVYVHAKKGSIQAESMAEQAGNPLVNARIVLDDFSTFEGVPGERMKSRPVDSPEIPWLPTDPFVH